MTPSSTVPNHTNRRDIYVKFLCYFFHRKLSFKRANFQDFFFYKFVPSVFRSFLRLASLDDVIAMPLIVFPSDVFQIFKSWIANNSIFMVYFMIRRRRTDKREHNKLMYLKSLRSSVNAQLNPWIAMRANVWLEKSSFGVYAVSFAEYISKIANSIRLKSGYCFPDFHNSIVPQAGVLLKCHV
jgi:hypothetical protein